jgi:hypothetical protein
MFQWLRRRPKTESVGRDAPLRGAPVQPRRKTRSAATGHVYQYTYRGFRTLTSPPGTEYVFDASRDRGEIFAIRVRLLESAQSECVSLIGRELLGVEQYAIAKMTLFAAFDELDDVADLRVALEPAAKIMQTHLQVLGR